MSDTTTDFFDGVGEGTGAPTAVLKNIGDYAHGEIVKMFKKDYIPFGKTEVEKKADGTNRQQLVIVLQTQFRNWQNVVKVPKVDFSDPNSPEKAPAEDTGERAVYAPEGSNIQYAIARALNASKAKFEVGGTLGVKIVNLKDTGKGNPLKEHEAVYTAPAASAGFFPDAPAEQAPAAQPAATAPAAQAPAQQAAAPAASAPVAQDPWATPGAPAGTQPPPF